MKEGRDELDEVCIVRILLKHIFSSHNKVASSFDKEIPPDGSFIANGSRHYADNGGGSCTTHMKMKTFHSIHILA